MQATTLCFALCFLVVLSSCRIVNAEKCYPGRGNAGVPVPMKLDPENCEWYKPKACCTTAQADNVTSVQDGNCKELSSDCFEQWNLLMCGMECSPLQVELYKISAIPSQAGFALCEGFADDLYSSCKDDEFLVDGTCQVVSSKYSDAEKWIKADNRLFYGENDGLCFNQATRVAFEMMAVATLCVLSSM